MLCFGADFRITACKRPHADASEISVGESFKFLNAVFLSIRHDKKTVSLSFILFSTKLCDSIANGKFIKKFTKYAIFLWKVFFFLRFTMQGVFIIRCHHQMSQKGCSVAVQLCCHIPGNVWIHMQGSTGKML